MDTTSLLVFSELEQYDDDLRVYNTVIRDYYFWKTYKNVSYSITEIIEYTLNTLALSVISDLFFIEIINNKEIIKCRYQLENSDDVVEFEFDSRNHYNEYIKI